jgi:adenylate cyclase
MKSRHLKFKALGLASASALLLLLFITNALVRFEYMAQDRLYRDFSIIHPDIFVFGIDEETLIEFGPFQYWSRQRMADAISILNSEPGWEPAVIAVDMIFSGYSNDPAADEALVNAAAEVGNVVFGATVSLDWKGDVKTFEKSFDSLGRVSSYGILNAIIDDDGIVRKAEVGIEVFGSIEPTFPEAIYRMYTGRDVEIPAGIRNPMHLAFSGGVGDYYGAMGLGTSFRDIFNEDFDPSFYADAIIMIGPYAAGLLDSYFTAIDYRNQMHGVEIHANIVQMLLDGNFKGYAPQWVNLAALVAMLVLFSLVLIRFGDRVSLAVLVLFVAGYVFLNQRLFSAGTILTLIYLPISAAVLYAFSVVYNYITERAEKRKIKDMFKKYVDPKLVDVLMQSDMAHGSVGQKKHFAVLFVDIRGFTPMSEKLKDEPETVVHILNDYLELTASCIFNNGGSVDKFIGDATMALFNGFTPLDDYTYHACKAAIDIVNGATELNAQIKEKHGFGVGFGVGVHCGYAVVGNIGPHFRKDYTAIGDTVNTAARLESNAEQSQVLISKEVCEMLEGRITTDPLGEVTMKGKGPVEVFALTGVQ